MHLIKVPFTLVASDIAKTQPAAQDSSFPSSRSQRFCTAQHARSEIVAVVPETSAFRHETPPWTAYGYTLWHPLIAQSQGLTEYHEILIPSSLYEDLMRCHGAWVAQGSISPSLLAEVIVTLLYTRAGKKLTPLLNGTKKWFIRLDQMSPKDSPCGGKLPSSTIEEVLTKICTSMRAYGCLQREHEDAEKEKTEMQIKLVLNPWDEGKDASREFRIFAPPPAASVKPPTPQSFAISGISQYKWCFVFEAPWNLSLEETVAKVEDGAEKVLRDIVAYTEKEPSGEIMELLLKYGFSYDVALQEDCSVQLVEINPFGALSGCGACLFDWVMDGEVLYGLQEAQFTVTV